MKVSTLNKATGEVIELETNNLTEVMEACKIASQYEKLAKDLKDQLKKQLPKYLDESGKSEEVDGYQFKQIHIQRRTYDKSVLREMLDEDVVDLFLKVDKGGVDNYIKDNLDRLGDISTRLRESMIDDGRPYSQTKLEKL